MVLELFNLKGEEKMNREKIRKEKIRKEKIREVYGKNLQSLLNGEVKEVYLNYGAIGEEGIESFSEEFPLLSFSVSLKKSLVLVRIK